RRSSTTCPTAEQPPSSRIRRTSLAPCAARPGPHSPAIEEECLSAPSDKGPSPGSKVEVLGYPESIGTGLDLPRWGLPRGWWRTTMTQFTLNGKPVEVGDHPHLLAALREELDVTSPKDGCSPSGQCGCCTVLIDGKASVSCQMSLERVAGKSVTTLEGFDSAERARFAAAFAAKGALQCGFCTPGILVRVKALIDKKGSALTREEAARHLGAHLCRCTGYTKILDAVELLASGESPPVIPVGGLGTRGARYEGIELALGDRDYVDDIRVPGMLHGALRLADHARADVLKID